LTISKDKLSRIQSEAERGVALAQFRLGELYLTGDGLPRDHAKVFEWYSRAADQGNVSAYEGLAFLYRKGLGVGRNPSEEAKWTARAANAGNVRCQAHLGRLYWKGIGLEKNEALAYAWYKIAYIYGYRYLHHRLLCFLARQLLTRQQLQFVRAFVMDWLEKRGSQH
jgi:TPR repeat protein